MFKKKLFYQTSIVLFIVAQFSYLFLSSLLVKPAHAATFTTGFTTMTNSRFSYLAAVQTNVSGGDKNVTIATSGQSDNNTGNLFPGDTLCFNNSASNGCNANTTYTVQNVLDADQFGVTAGITGGLLAGMRVVASQSARLAISFAPVDVTNVTKLRVYIPAASSNSGDGIPDAGKFDANTLDSNVNASNVITISGGSASISNKTYGTTTIGGQTYHNILMDISSISAGTTYTLTIGHASTVTDRFINPSPSGTSHTRGVGDKMVITIQTEDSSANIVDKADTGVTPNDGVFVSAYVPTSVTWTISAIAAGATAPGTHSCTGVTTTVATTADNTYGVTVPFGTIYSTDSFFDAAHRHTITTNAGGGYILSVMEDGALKKDGSSPSIADGSCDGGCSTTVAAAWSTATNNGFGYTLGGTDAAFTSNYKVFDSTGFQTIASRATTGTGVTTDVCYRLSVGPTQQAGFYYNKLTYQAYPRF